ncbi:MAG TPA: hypothetical protein VFO16_14695 [Pseudonocardiaceae bacterium]|nr:hypothetical protein [Pseudonocardiaceae bacterium]
MTTPESPDLAIGKRLLDYLKLSGFRFERIAPARTARYSASETPTNGATPSTSPGSAIPVVPPGNASPP